MPRSLLLLKLLVGALLVAGCGAAVQHPFPNRDPLWVDRDRRPFASRPAELYTPPRWDVIDNTLFRPLGAMWTFEQGSEAINVNALDEVPDSSWFTNRARRVGPDEIARGACGDDPPPPLPWRVTQRKLLGTRAGFVMRAADQSVWFVRTDEVLREHASASDAIATRLIWAAGYNTPCNRVGWVTPADLVLAPEEEGEDAPTQADIDRVVQRATRATDGRLRVSLSRYIEGEPIGGWQFAGVREDDPNDVVPHEHRRDVRGMVVLSAWLNHIDSRAENNLDSWIEVGNGYGYVRHYVLDASDSFGVVWHGSYLLSQRFGHSHYLDLGQLAEDFFTLGAIDRPYYVDDDERGLAADALGYYDVERFDPDRWRNGYPNRAFEHATERDRAWMARIIAALDEADVRAAVETGHFTRPLHSGELVRIVMGRRTRILERYLTRLSPLAHPRTEGAELCLEDLALTSGIRDADERGYAARALRGWPAVPADHLRVELRGDQACVQLPSADASAGAPAYWIVELVASTAGAETTGPARVHLTQLGPRRYRVVGLEREEPTGR